MFRNEISAVRFEKKSVRSSFLSYFIIFILFYQTYGSKTGLTCSFPVGYESPWNERWGDGMKFLPWPPKNAIIFSLTSRNYTTPVTFELVTCTTISIIYGGSNIMLQPALATLLYTWKLSDRKQCSPTIIDELAKHRNILFRYENNLEHAPIRLWSFDKFSVFSPEW